MSSAHQKGKEIKKLIYKLLSLKRLNLSKKIIEFKSKAAVPLAEWVVSSVKYSRVIVKVEHLKKNLEDTELELELSKINMARCKAELVEINNQVQENLVKSKSNEASILEKNDEREGNIIIAANNLIGKLSLFEENYLGVWILQLMTKLQTSKDLMNLIKNYVDIYKRDIAAELFECVDQLVDLVTNRIIKAHQSSEPMILFYKMLGDYLRYRCEFDKDNIKYQEMSEKYYKSSTIYANDLDPFHQFRLGQYLNFSVFYYEIKGKKKAMEMAQVTIDKLQHKDTQELNETQKQIKKLLEENLDIWKSNF